MTTNFPDYRCKKTLAERKAEARAQREGPRKGATLEELSKGPEVFESDEELYAFLKFVREERNRNLC